MPFSRRAAPSGWPPVIPSSPPAVAAPHVRPNPPIRPSPIDAAASPPSGARQGVHANPLFERCITLTPRRVSHPWPPPTSLASKSCPMMSRHPSSLQRLASDGNCASRRSTPTGRTRTLHSEEARRRESSGAPCVAQQSSFSTRTAGITSCGPFKYPSAAFGDTGLRGRTRPVIHSECPARSVCLTERAGRDMTCVANGHPPVSR